MMDSWSPWKLDPGFVVMYSKLSDFNTSIMKSEPGFSTIRSTRRGAPLSAASWASFGTTAEGRAGAAGVASWAFAAGVATRAAALAAAPFRKPRRLTEPFLGLMRPPEFSAAARLLLVDDLLEQRNLPGFGRFLECLDVCV